jgi:hypothetical protein
MSVKREVITGVLLIIVIAPALVQAVAPAQENDVLPLVDLDIWVDQLSVYYYNWTQLDRGDVIYVDFEVTSGSDITFFICDAENYEGSILKGLLRFETPYHQLTWHGWSSSWALSQF